MRKAMSKKVGAGGRFDIFLDSAASFTSHSMSHYLGNSITAPTAGLFEKVE